MSRKEQTHHLSEVRLFVIKHFHIGRLQKQSFFFSLIFRARASCVETKHGKVSAPRLYMAIIKQSQDSNKVLILVRWLKIWVKEFHFFILLSNIFHKYNAMNIYKQ